MKTTYEPLPLPWASYPQFRVFFSLKPQFSDLLRTVTTTFSPATNRYHYFFRFLPPLLSFFLPFLPRKVGLKRTHEPLPLPCVNHYHHYHEPLPLPCVNRYHYFRPNDPQDCCERLPLPSSRTPSPNLERSIKIYLPPLLSGIGRFNVFDKVRMCI